jgi:hypothetical protein
MPITEIKRPNYYEGQYLGAQDLTAAQEYQRQQDQRHRLAAHTWGIAAGLELEERPQPGSGDAVDIYVKPGYAVDGFGRAIVVLEPYKIPEALFAQFAFDPTLPAGRWIPVWLRYREEKTDPPRPGYAICDAIDQAFRIQETFRIIVGVLSVSQRRDQISVAGKLVDADKPDKQIPDASVPYQMLPDPGDDARWPICLGSVRWLAPNPPFPTTGHFVKSAPGDESNTREGRTYIGVVAETVLAPAGKLRLKDRLTPTDRTKETSDFAAVEGSLRIDENAHIRGNVGIGTTAPTHKFHVLAGNAVGLFESTGSEAFLKFTTNEGLNNRVEITNRSGGRLSLWTSGGGDAFNITRDGNVGIGTTAPTHKFHVLAQDAVGLFESTGAQAFLGLSTSEGPNNRVEITNRPGGRLSLFTYGAGDVLNITQSGNVGIGTSTPGFKLDVAGAVHATNIPNSSDERLKANVTPLGDVLEKIQKVRGVSFDWNEKFASLGRSTGKRELGLLGHEVEAVFPELVTKWGDENYLAIDYGRLSAVLVEAVKELATEIKALHKRIDALEKRSKKTR